MMYWTGLFTICVFALGYLIGKTEERKNQEQLRRIAERAATWKYEEAADSLDTQEYVDKPVDKPEYNHSYGDPEVVKWIDDNQAKKGDS